MSQPRHNESTVARLAAHVGGRVIGDGNRRIVRCNGLVSAGPEDISFLANARYARHLATTGAGCVVLGRDMDPAQIERGNRSPLTVIQTDDPYYGFRQIVVLLHGFRPHPAVGVSPLAAIAPSAKLGADVQVHPFVSIGKDVLIGARCILYPHVTVMDGCRIGDDCILYPAVTVYDQCVLGARVVLHAGTVVGGDGYGFATHQGVHHKIPQIGNVVVEDDVEIGANTVLERAAMESTIIGRGTKLGNSVVIGHNCRIGEHNLLVSQVGIAGSTTTGRHVVMAGQAGVAGHLNIGEMVRVAAQSGVIADVPAGRDIGGSPSLEMRQARKVYLQFVQLPELARRVQQLENALKKLQAQGEDGPAGADGNPAAGHGTGPGKSGQIPGGAGT